MTEDKIKIGKNDCSIKNFDNIVDFKNYLKDAKENSIFRGKRVASQESGTDGGFRDYESFVDALKAFEYGTDKYYEEFKKKYKIAKDYIERHLARKTAGFKKNVVGFLPIVPNVLIGNPINMIDNNIKPKKIPTAKVVIDRSALCSVTCGQIIDFQTIIFSLIQVLEEKGVRCEINIVDTSSERDGDRHEITAYSLKIKEYLQPLNLFKIQFPIISPDMLRRIYFRVKETDNNIKLSDWHFGYGSTLRNRCDGDYFKIEKGEVSEGYQKLLGINKTDIYIPSIDNFIYQQGDYSFDERFKEIIQKTNFNKYFAIGEM